MNAFEFRSSRFTVWPKCRGRTCSGRRNILACPGFCSRNSGPLS